MKVILRCALTEDKKFVLNLRNKDYVRKQMWNTEKIDKYGHNKFWSWNHDKYYIINYEGTDVGFVRHDGNISIAILKKYQNMGIGTFVLNGIKGMTTIKKANRRSINAFTKAGFKIVGLVLKKD